MADAFHPLGATLGQEYTLVYNDITLDIDRLNIVGRTSKAEIDLILYVNGRPLDTVRQAFKRNQTRASIDLSALNLVMTETRPGEFTAPVSISRAAHYVRVTR